MRNLIIALLIFAALFVFAGFKWGYAIRDSQIEGALIRTWIDRYNVTEGGI